MSIPEDAEDLQDLTERTAWGGFQQDLHKIFSQGPVPHQVRTPRGQELLTRTCTRSRAWEPAAQTLCEPAQSKCHKSHFMREFTGTQMKHPDQAPALTLTVRTPQCGHTVWRTSAIVAFIMYFSSVAFTRLNHSGLLEHVVSEPQSEYPLNDWPF